MFVESRGRRSGRRGCLIRALVTMLAVLLGLLIVGAIAAWLLLFKPVRVVERGRPVQVSVPDGTSTAGIATLLSDAGVIANPNMFRLQSRLSGADGKLKAGVYDLSTGMPYDLVIERLEAGPPVEYVAVTVPEGFTLEQIAARMEKQASIPASTFLSAAHSAGRFSADHPYLASAYKGSLEGYLFPKTYRIEKGSTADDVIRMMLDQFDSEIASAGISTDGANSMTLNEIVVIASMVERETRVDRERAAVSSVIYNRLRIGMRLEIDATIEYVLPGNRFRLRYSDLKLRSPYNTYLNAGLPPGPIANPGLDALEAAAHPAKTQYIYYVLTGKDGTHTFATNVQDFLKAKHKSKEVFGR